MKNLLVVEDEEHIASGLKFNLEAEGYAVEVEEGGEAALNRLTNGSDSVAPVDLVLLDVMLPGIDGFEVVRTLREAGSFVPVVMLTARGHTDDVLKGFQLGADDYLTKPFDLPILLARIQGIFRRKRWLEQRSGEGPAEELDEFRFDGKRIDFSRQVLIRDDVEHRLTLMETTLLRYLIQSEGVAVDRKVLLKEVWGVRQDTDTRTIDNFVARLRRAIENRPSNPKHLQTVRGVGYRFVAAPEMASPEPAESPDDKA
jgi:DNA-binding response OmpR family regulator